MTTGGKQNRAEYTTPDLACTRCRERKIRCGRERPQCSNCKRDGGVVCVYQNPAKRVNHMKLLYEGVDQLQRRLTTIESHLDCLVGTVSRSVDWEDRSSTGPPQHQGAGPRSADEDNDDAPSEASSSHAADSPNQLDAAGHYRGVSSLRVLCDRFQAQVLIATNGEAIFDTLRVMLQNLCEIPGVIEPFPGSGDQDPIQLLPKQRSIAATDHLFQYVNYATDVFVHSHLRANLERVYTHPSLPDDDIWAICFKVITLLVLQLEISTQASNALFGDFAQSILPSRAALISSRLLTTPRLVSVQTLILLSIAAQHFDPPGWTELIFAHACILARTMGLHHAQSLSPEASADEALERTKVLHALYSRDKSLCTTRGSVSWMSGYDGNLTSQISSAVECQAPYTDRLQLALIQDEIYRLTHTATDQRFNSPQKTQKVLQSIEERLDQYAQTFDIFNPQIFSQSRSVITLEFLTTRILALQHGSEVRHAKRADLDARASCLLLLIVHGDNDRQTLDAFQELTCHARSSTQNHTEFISEGGPVTSTNLLDAFSIPAFFILVGGVFHTAVDDGETQANTDLDLLRRVSRCYTKATARMQSNSYNRKVSLIFEQVLKIIDVFKHGRHSLPVSDKSPGEAADMSLSGPSPGNTPLPPLMMDFPGLSTSLPNGDLSSSTSWLPSTKSPLSWPNSLSIPSPLGPNAFLNEINMMDIGGSTPHGLIAQILDSPPQLLVCSEGEIQRATTVSETLTSRKRLRTDNTSDLFLETDEMSLTSELHWPDEEIPFYLIS